MIRVALHSQDRKLQPLLAPALGRDFQVVVQADDGGLKESLAGGSFDVLILDLDTNYSGIESQINLFNDVSELGIGIVIMTDDGGRASAIELVQRGAHSYCRKPPALRELKAIVRRAYEHTVMRREL